jgi:hypothetical protein
MASIITTVLLGINCLLNLKLTLCGTYFYYTTAMLILIRPSLPSSKVLDCVVVSDRGGGGRACLFGNERLLVMEMEDTILDPASLAVMMNR